VQGSAPVEAELRETVDYIAIRRLQDAYADVVTRRAWPELVDLFRPEAEVVLDIRDGGLRTLTGPRGVGDFIGAAIERFEYFQFVVLGTRVELDADNPDRASARLYMCELRQTVDGGHGSVAFGVYHDDYLRHDGRWWFARRRYHSLARTAPHLAVFPFPDVSGR
jgi:SnoaL-like protein